MTVTDIRRTRPWSSKSRNHGWDDIDVDGDHHECRFCGVRYHSEPDGTGGYIKAWRHGVRSGRSRSMGKCPGPDGRPSAPVVATSGDVASSTVVEDTQDTTPAPAGRLSCRVCPPPCDGEAHPRLGVDSCDAGVAAVRAARDRYWSESVLGVRPGGAA